MSEQDNKDPGIWSSQVGLSRVLHGTLAMTKPDGGLQGRTECGCNFEMLNLPKVMDAKVRRTEKCFPRSII